MNRGIVTTLVLGGLLAAGCGGAPSRPAEDPADRFVRVPRLVGLPESRAECVLEESRLRWAVGGGQVRRTARRSCDASDDGTGSAVSTDSRVVRQRPRPGQRVTVGEVIRFETRCSRLRLRPDGAACA